MPNISDMSAAVSNSILFSTEFLAIPAGGGDQLVWNQTTGEKEILSGQDVEILRICQQPRSISEHLDSMEEDWGYRPEWSEFQGMWQDLVNKGWLLSVETFQQSFNAKAATESAKKPVHISAFTIPMRAVGPALVRCLKSVEPHMQENGRKMELILVSEQDDVDAAREVVGNMTCDMEPRWIGPREREVFIRWLVKETTLSPELCAYALKPDVPGIKIGALRNAQLLECVDQHYLSTDDDTVWDLRRPRTSSEATILGGFEAALWNYELLTTDALNYGEEVASNIFELHERFLGKSASELIAAAKTLKIYGLDLTLRKSLNNPHSRVGMSVTGYRGDAAFTDFSTLLSFPKNEIPPWFQESSAYQSFLSAQEVSVSGAGLLCGNFCAAGMGMALDATAELPPFPPLHRNEDGLFQLFLQHNQQRLLSVGLPETLYHKRQETRFLAHTYAESLQADPSMDKWVSLLFHSYQEGSVVRDAGSFGIWLRESITHEPESMTKYLVSIYDQYIWNARTTLSMAFKGKQLPAVFRSDLNKATQILEEKLLNSTPVWPREFQGRAEPLTDFLKELCLLGELLEKWPLFLAAARHHKQVGQRLSVALR